MDDPQQVEMPMKDGKIVVNKNSLPLFNMDDWPTFRRLKQETKMTRLKGNVVIETSSGFVEASGGYIAIDAEGFPYPITESEAKKIYEPTDQKGEELFNG